MFSRRYAAACRRARRAAALQRFIDDVFDIYKSVELALVPARHAMGGAANKTAAAFAAAAERAHGGRVRAGQTLEDLAAGLPRIRLLPRSRLNTIIAFAALAGAVFAFAFYDTGLEVVVDGRSMGYVSRQSEFREAVEAVNVRVASILGEPFFYRPDVSFRLGVARRSQIFDTARVEQYLFGNIAAVSSLYVLSVDGKPVAANASYTAIRDVLESILEQYPLFGDFDSCSFTQDIEIKYQAADVRISMDAAAIKDMLTAELRPAVHDTVRFDDTIDLFCQRNGISREWLETINGGADLSDPAPGRSLLVKIAVPYLSVSMSRRIDYVEPIAFSTVYVDDNSLFEDETARLVEGVDGLANVLADQNYLDGQVVGATIVATEVAVEPVDEVIAKGTKIRYTTGKFIRPHPGAVTSGYGYRISNGTRGFHSGIDIGGPTGSNIVASDGGQVIYSGWNGSYGNCVIIKHANAYTTLYAHCSKLLVKNGQNVGQGEVIALVGSTGRSTGPHVHFEISRNGQRLNPATLLPKR
jgi:murein DD-endopeptidase MepM/ murein hydrolase activator NlpD